MLNFERMSAAMRDMISRRGDKETQKPNVEDLYKMFLQGSIGQGELLQSLRPQDVAAFTHYHDSVKHMYENSENRKVFFKLNQLNNLIEDNLENSVRRAHGENVIDREN